MAFGGPSEIPRKPWTQEQEAGIGPRGSNSKVDLIGPRETRLQLPQIFKLKVRIASQHASDTWTISKWFFSVSESRHLYRQKVRSDRIIDTVSASEWMAYSPPGFGVWMKMATTCLSSSGLSWLYCCTVFFHCSLLSIEHVFQALLQRWESNSVQPNCPWDASYIFRMLLPASKLAPHWSLLCLCSSHWLAEDWC